MASIKKQFTESLLNDLNALEKMLDKNLFEKDITRIGAEQEFCIIDYALRPAMKAIPMLEHLNDNHFTTELAQFNLELNLKPLNFTGNCLSQLENNLVKKLTKANKIAHALGAKIILTAILPTISKNEMQMENITPKERYKRLNKAILAARSSDFKFHISGIDELIDKHDNVLFESCNTSFQLHFQVDPAQTRDLYNWSQVISGPVLAAATNSPLFLGKRLWRETRIALFQQSADTRKSISPYREEPERVSFGKQWVYRSPLTIFQDIVRQHSILLPFKIDNNALETLEKGKTPRLKALCMHNSTIYSWNRLCYGVTNLRPHFRIENRYLPSGPTLIDETANAALWTGLMNGMPEKYQSIHEKMDFAYARHNFFSAAKMGLHTQFTWLNEKLITAQDLILHELLPIARKGLTDAHIAKHDIDRYLGVVEKRVSQGKTGSQWMLNSFNRLIQEMSPEEASITLTEGIYRRQKNGSPVHEWSDLQREEGGGWRNRFRYVKQLMVKDIITLQKDDLLALARNIMLWSKIYHIPIEDQTGRLVGLLSANQMLELLGIHSKKDFRDLTVGDVMNQEVLYVSPETQTHKAYQIMRQNELECLPVVVDSKLVGILTKNDYLRLMGYFFREAGEQNGA